MNIILTANGKGLRFSQKGYKTPKFLLPYKNRPIIYHIIKNLNLNSEDCLWVLLNKNIKSYETSIIKLLSQIRNEANLFWMNDTNGQATTVNNFLLANKDFSGPFWVINCDTINFSGLAKFDQSIDIGAQTFDGTGEFFSYFDDLYRPSRIAEKIEISTIASNGNYFFGSPRIFLEDYSELNSEGKELFVSDVLNVSFSKSRNVKLQHLEKDQVLVLGTPPQYEEAISRL